MSAGAIKAQGLLPPLLLHRYRWILPSICIHHGWHVFHGGTAVTGVRQSSIIPGLTIPNLLYRPFSLRQKFFFLPHQYRRNARKCISTLSRICRSRINVMFQKKIKNDSIPYTLIYARQNSKKKKKSPLHASFPNNSDFIRQLCQWCHRPLDLTQRSTHRSRTNFYSLNSCFAW